MKLNTDLYAGDNDAQRNLWNSYVQGARQAVQKAMTEQPNKYSYVPDKSVFNSLPNIVTHAVTATCLSVFALEFRLKRVLLVLAKRDKAIQLGSAATQLSKAQAKCIGNLELSTLIKCDEFWFVLGKYRNFLGVNTCTIDALGRSHWTSLEPQLRFAKDLRNAFVHGDAAKLDKTLDLNALQNPVSQSQLCKRAQSVFNGFVDVMAMINLYTDYPIKSKTLKAALAEYAHLRV